MRTARRPARLLVAAAPVLLILAGATACSSAAGAMVGDGQAPGTSTSTAPGTSATGASSPAVDESAAGQPTAGEPASPAARIEASPVSRTGQAPACAPGDIKPALIGQARAGTATARSAMLQLTNKSGHTCRLYGWAGVTLYNAAAEAVFVPTQKVPQPGAPVTVDLKPGATASAGIKWTICDKQSSDCPAGNTLIVSLPGRATGVPANLAEFPALEKSDITMTSLEIGSIQPSHEGVVAW